MRSAECQGRHRVEHGSSIGTPHSALRTPHLVVPVSDLPYRVEKPWGHELIWARTDRYVGKILHIEPGHVLSLQYHNKKDESIYVLTDRKSTRLNSSHSQISYAVFCLKKKKRLFVKTR